jgi:hypothetical protein
LNLGCVNELRVLLRGAQRPKTICSPSRRRRTRFGSNLRRNEAEESKKKTFNSKRARDKTEGSILAVALIIQAPSKALYALRPLPLWDLCDLVA